VSNAAQEPRQTRVVILSGPVGAGKTTVAAGLKSLWQNPLVCIEGDKFLPFIAKPKPAERQADFRMMMRSMMAAAGPIARSGYDVLIDYAVPPPFMKTAAGILKEIPVDYVMLLPSLTVCADRVANRSKASVKAYNPESYGIFGGAPRYTVVEERAPAAVLVRQIFDGLEAGRFRFDSSE
jgi:hypothetical protein